MYKIFHEVSSVIVLNLEKETERKRHFTEQFKQRDIPFEIFNAVSSDDYEVKNFFRNNDVRSFPPCFRCKQNSCDCDNNFLTPKQVANFLSFKKIMEKIVENQISSAIILEDDIQFLNFAKKSFRHLHQFVKKNKLLEANYPFLFKIGSHTKVKKRYFFKLFILNKSTFIENNHEHMANPCFMINIEFAKYFLSQFQRIESTSDDFIHRTLIIDFKIKSYTIYPMPVTQLSYGIKNLKFNSTITPAYNEYEFNSTSKVSSKVEYENLLKNWLNN